MNKITNINDFMNEIKKDISLDSKKYFYRGQGDKGYKLIPTIYRQRVFLENEHKMFQDIIALCPNDFVHNDTTFNKLVKMQHYSLPTRLLDITTNPLVSLFYACDGYLNNIDDEKDGKVFMFEVDIDEVKYFSSDTISVISNISKIKTGKDYLDLSHFKENLIELQEHEQNYKYMRYLLHEIKQEKPQFQCRIEKKHIKSIQYVIPKNDNERIIAQNGAFIIFGIKGDTKNIEYPMIQKKQIKKEIIIDKNYKESILKELQQFHGIDKKTLFPDIDNVALEIKKYYGSISTTTRDNKKDINIALSSSSKSIDKIQKMYEPKNYYPIIHCNFLDKKQKTIFLNKLNFSDNVSVNKELFIKMLANSLSLNQMEKERVIQEIPNLTQFQINELIKVWEEENIKFTELKKAHPDDILKLSYKMIAEWYQLLKDKGYKLNSLIDLFDNLFEKNFISNKNINDEIKIIFLNYELQKNNIKDEDIIKIFEKIQDKDNNLNNIIKVLNNNKQFDLIFKFFDDFISEGEKDSDKYYSIASLAVNIAHNTSKDIYYKKAFEYLENVIKDKNNKICVIDYVEIALILKEIQKAQDYMNNNDMKLSCYDNTKHYRYLYQLMEILLGLINKESENTIKKKVKILQNELDNIYNINLDWNFKEIYMIIEQYRIKTKAKKFKLEQIINKLQNTSNKTLEDE